MVAFTTQTRRFAEQLRDAGETDLSEFGFTLSALRLQIASLIMDCPPRSQEQACRAATRLLDKADHGDDINAANVSWLVSRPELRPFSRERAGRCPASERLAALAAWKWIDLADTIGSNALTPAQRIMVDAGLAVVTTLTFEAMVAVIGEFDDLSQDQRDKADKLLKQQASMRAHAGREQKIAPIKQRLVADAMALRGERTRRHAARLVLQRFAKATPGAAPSLPTLRTLEGWLGQAGWIPRDSSVCDAEK
ncbi:hypothetical protein CDN99_26100 [Roseateles aquatilis]|uniref:Uncharacterized protein n=1 Tax=Roseateles aquatilis TaxID=431061 RepID=A0A246ITR5_9BURK|nr:hypothetical protein [Roseateles aquatilis]OWQ83605.1 hypothetical protein CDN99_26100 [Roseateles aquatilis]